MYLIILTKYDDAITILSRLSRNIYLQLIFQVLITNRISKLGE